MQQLQYKQYNMFSYPHPLINDGAGRIKTDPVNEERIQKVLSRYQQWAEKNNIKSKPLRIDKETVNKSKIFYPIIGFAVGILGSFAFVHPGSKYIGKVFTAGTTFVGWKIAKRYEKSYNSCRYFTNFPNYPTDIQKMIDNNDARYAHRWLKDTYLEINP